MSAAESYMARRGAPDLLCESAGDETRCHVPGTTEQLPRWKSHAVEMYYLGRGIKVECRDGRVSEKDLTVEERERAFRHIRLIGRQPG
jgi:hypothetical protein